MHWRQKEDSGDTCTGGLKKLEAMSHQTGIHGKYLALSVQAYLLPISYNES